MRDASRWAVIAVLGAALAMGGCAAHEAVLLGPKGAVLGRLYSISLLRRDRAAARVFDPEKLDWIELCVDDESISGNATLGAIALGAAAGSLAGPVGVAAGAGAGGIASAAGQALGPKPAQTKPVPFWCFPTASPGGPQ